MQLYVIITYDHIIRCISDVAVVMYVPCCIYIEDSGMLCVALFRILDWLYKGRFKKGSKF